MKKLVLLGLLLQSVIWASEAFMSVETLSKKLTQKNLVILDVGSQTIYRKGHIIGAIHANAGSFRRSVEKYKLMKSPHEVEAIIQSLGINNDSEVVIYDHSEKKGLLKASYTALALISHGLENVSILDGSYSAWEEEFEETDNEDNYISTDIETPKDGNFKAHFNPNILIDMNYVKNKINKVPMLEARPSQFYYGTAKSYGVKRIGHIPHAMSSFWKDKFTPLGFLRPESQLKEIFIDGFELNPKKEVILYCTGGLEASMNWFILYKHMGFKNAKIYDASMKQWANRDDTPMVRFKWEVFYK